MALKNQPGLIKIIDAIECVEKCLSCAICLEISSDPVETRCGHLFCRTCIQKVLSHPGESCPVCKLNLTRRSVSSSDQMGLCIQQLSKLVDAIRGDTGIDITSCLKTHYKNRAFLPSVCSSSPQSRQVMQNQIPSSETDNNTDKAPQSYDECAIPQAEQDNRLGSNQASAEYSTNELREPTNNNLSGKLITTKSKLQEIMPRSIPTSCNPSSRIRNKNVLRPENTTCITNKSKLAIENAEVQQFDPKVNDVPEAHLDQSFDQRRKCLKDISTLNQNQSRSDQSTKTWSRVAKFGKELRRKSGTMNSSRLHKKGRLYVNVRNKSAVSNALLNNSIGRQKSGQDRVDHDINTNMSLMDRHEDDMTVSDGTMIKPICEKANPATCNHDDQTMLKTKEQEPMISITGQSHDENVASEANRAGSKCVGNKAGKRSFEEEGKLSDTSLNVDLGKSVTAESTRIVRDKENQAFKVGSHKELRTKRTQYTNAPENVVRFKKLGHLFKAHRKSVAFLYLGTMKSRESEVYSGSTVICKLCSSCRISDESPLIQTHSLGSTVSFKRAKSFGSSSLLPARSENLPINPKPLPLPALCTDRTADSDKRIECAESNNPFGNVSVSKIQTISTKNYPQCRDLSADDRSPLAPAQMVAEKALQRESPESSIIKRKRKRSESPDHENQCPKKQSGERVSSELSRTENENIESCRQDYLFNTTLPSQALTPRSTKTTPSKVHEMDTTDVNETAERLNVDIDFRKKNALRKANIASRTRVSRSSSESMTVTTPVLPKTVNPMKSRDLVSLKAYPLSGPDTAATTQNAELHKRDEGEINPLEDSMMDITGEELLLKKFEENLFGPRISENIRQPSGCNEKQGEDNPDSSAIENPKLLPEPLDHSVSIPKTALVKILPKPKDNFLDENEFLISQPLIPYGISSASSKKNVDFQGCNQSLDNEDFIELTPTNGILNRLNNPPEISRNEDIAAVQVSEEILQNYEHKKSAQTPLPSISRESKDAKRHTQAESNTKIRPLYQSTPKSLQREPTDRYPLNVYRQKELGTNAPITNLEDNKIARSLQMDRLRGHRGCIVCSGLTTKQSEDVRSLSSLVNMQYTKNFSSDVTHVIVKTNENNGACKTLKYLQGVAYRKWVLNFDWIVDCVSQQKLLNEETYEVVDSTTLIPGPRKARIGEEGVFESFVFLCVEPFQNISVPDYQDLLRHMGATVVRSLDELAAQKSILKIIAVQAGYHENKIIEWHRITKAVPVAQEWIVECISQYRLVSFLPFLQELVPQDVLDLGFPEELIQDDDSDFMYEVSA